MGLKLTFYGDDFTGSSAVMEVLSFAGVPTMLFLAPPRPEDLAAYPELEAVGVAGIARSKDPGWMRAHLPGVFSALKALGAPLAHYKVCSTFDSAPDIGAIGVAAEIGAEVFAPDWMPLVVGAPQIGRYQMFGTLFAAADGRVHRLDRHPVMARHPVTPMDEADLCRHLARQTDLPMDVVDLTQLAADGGRSALSEARGKGARIVALDAFDAASLRASGALMDAERNGFAIGSQGVEYALVAHWQATGRIPQTVETPPLTGVEQIFCVTGSCAPTTAAQIAFAEAQGFEVLEVNAFTAVDPDLFEAECARVLSRSLTGLRAGRDVLVTTARGPDCPQVVRVQAALRETGTSAQQVNDRLGQALGRLVALVRAQTGLPRVAIGGGDTSGHALSALQAEALSPVAPLAPGAPLCRVHSRAAPGIDGLEVTLKGGQMGDTDFFVRAKTGAA